MQDPAGTQPPRRFTLKDVGKFLGGISEAVIDQQIRRTREMRRAPGRPQTFAAEVERWIETVVKERYDSRATLSNSELLNLLQYRDASVVSSDILRQRIRSMHSVRSVLGIPTEAERVAVGSEIVREWYRALVIEIEGVSQAFIYNFNETGCSDYADRREIRVLGRPTAMRHRSESPSTGTRNGPP
jgi:hypothetical protein